MGQESNESNGASGAGDRRRNQSASRTGFDRRAPAADDDSPRTRRLLRLGGASESETSDRLAGRFFRRSPLVFYRGGSWRLSANGSLKRWDVAAQKWESIRSGRWSSDEAEVVDAPQAAAPGPPDLTNDDDVWSSVEGCTFVGGTLDELCVYGKYTVVFGREAITMLSYQAGVVEIPCDDVVTVEIGGRGSVGESIQERETFAFQRAIDEMAATAVVKSLVERAGMDTSIRIETTKGEGYFHCDCATPDELRGPLAPFLAALPRGREGDSAQHVQLSGELVKLTDLRTRGLLTEEEFQSGVATALEDDR